jgi:hypothetical protein
MLPITNNWNCAYGYSDITLPFGIWWINRIGAAVLCRYRIPASHQHIPPIATANALSHGMARPDGSNAGYISYPITRYVLCV